ncbi:hypothetical protein F4779DRAFT_619827 [Xylariaceae sp. FL0662B]|nr:hypothetical protein F4779DRAFT_619827 [Xylariaceae sp. FL0662B]
MSSPIPIPNGRRSSNPGNAGPSSSRQAGRWSEIEDQLLKEGVRRHGVNEWGSVASLIWTKSAPECRARWAELVPVLHEQMQEQEAEEVIRRKGPDYTPAPLDGSGEGGDGRGRSMGRGKEKGKQKQQQPPPLSHARSQPATPYTPTARPAHESRTRRNTVPAAGPGERERERKVWRAPHPLMNPVPVSPPPVAGPSGHNRGGLGRGTGGRG